MITPSVKINKSYRKRIKCIKSVTKTKVAYTCRTVFFSFVNLLIKRNIFRVPIYFIHFIISVFLHPQKRCRCVIRQCVIPHGLLFMLLFAHKAKALKGKKKKKALFVGLGK